MMRYQKYAERLRWSPMALIAWKKNLGHHFLLIPFGQFDREDHGWGEKKYIYIYNNNIIINNILQQAVFLWKIHEMNRKEWFNSQVMGHHGLAKRKPIKSKSAKTIYWLVVTGTWLDSDFPFTWEFHHPSWLPHVLEGWLNHQPDYY